MWLEALGFFDRPGAITGRREFEHSDLRRGNERRTEHLAAAAARVLCGRSVAFFELRFFRAGPGVVASAWFSRALVGVVFHSTDGITPGCT